jgi:hypothetical protein
MRTELKAQWDTASTSKLSLRNSLKPYMQDKTQKVNQKQKGAMPRSRSRQVKIRNKMYCVDSISQDYSFLLCAKVKG